MEEERKFQNQLKSIKDIKREIACTLNSIHDPGLNTHFVNRYMLELQTNNKKFDNLEFLQEIQNVADETENDLL